ncbi:MAG: TM2 domain-containing protein [Cyanobacteria bacterium P01_D01_bin.56]
MGNGQEDGGKNKRTAAVLAFLGAIQPTPLPVAGIHKFYLGQYGWGVVYLLLGFTQVPRFASLAEGVWYLAAPQWQKLGGGSHIWLGDEKSTGPAIGETVEAVASSLREIEHLRQEGLLSEHEFEQKRRSLLEQMP